MGSNTKRSHEPIYKTYTKIEAKGLRATTFDTAILEKLPFWRLPKIISHFDGSNNIFADCRNIYFRQGQYWQIAYSRFLVAWKCIKIRCKNTAFYIFISSEIWSKFSSTALVLDTIYVKYCSTRKFTSISG